MLMKKRYLQEDNNSIIWHDEKGEKVILWNFKTRDLSIPGKIVDLTTGKQLEKSAGKYRIEGSHTYLIVDKKPIKEI